MEAFENEKMNNWIMGHVHALNAFGGSPHYLVCDNLKTGITKADNHDPIINLQFKQLAVHYGFAIIPARVRKPKDKPKVERAVQICYSIIEDMDLNNIHSTQEFNIELSAKVEDINNAPLNNGRRSRAEYLEIEKEKFIPLPINQYNIPVIRKCKVQNDYHVSFKKMFYSVPYKLVGETVFCEEQYNELRIFFNNQIIATHTILTGEPGQKSTCREHMHPRHKHYTPEILDKNKLLSISMSIGSETHALIIKIMQSEPVENQSFRLCNSILNFKNIYSPELLNKACELELGKASPSIYHSIKKTLNGLESELTQNNSEILQDNLNGDITQGQSASTTQPKDGGITRVKKYFK
jgi:hypothetical protein